MTRYHRQAFTILPLLLLCAALASCAGGGSDKSTTKSEYGPSYRERMSSTYNAMFKGDFSKRSSFESKVKTVKTDKTFKTDGFKSKNFTGSKDFYSGKKEVKHAAFSQADKSSNIANKTFSGADDQNRMSGDVYKTKESRYTDQANRNTGKSSSLGDDQFKVRNDGFARRAMENSKSPYIEKLENPSYSESEVRSILNKN